MYRTGCCEAGWCATPKAAAHIFTLWFVNVGFVPQFLTCVLFITKVSDSNSAQGELDRTNQMLLPLNQVDSACSCPYKPVPWVQAGKCNGQKCLNSLMSGLQDSWVRSVGSSCLRVAANATLANAKPTSFTLNSLWPVNQNTFCFPFLSPFFFFFPLTIFPW